ncbi:MAG: DsrE family protein [Chromatiales bacterium]|nr:DsrE family protein [Chromatiales bacterium]
MNRHPERLAQIHARLKRFRFLHRSFAGAVLTLLCAANAVADKGDPDFERVLNAAAPPPGVVFEVVQSREDDIRWALPLVADRARRLRERFPELAVAVVFHGKEEFALMRDRAERYPEAHAEVQALNSAGVNVHVCETHASWYRHSAADFPDYVKVVAAGPATLNDYEALDWVRLFVTRPGK